MDLKEIYENTIVGNADGVKELVRQALDEGVEPGAIISGQLIPAMTEVGDRFARNEFYVPEMLIAARAMQGGLAMLKPLLGSDEMISAGRVVIGTVKGDLHDIGKNLVAMMLEGAGFEVFDLGVDVSPEKFVEAVKEHQPHVVGLSALLTTTMVQMKTTVDTLVEAGVRDQVKVVIGGAPVTQSYADEIGADGYSDDAGGAARMTKAMLGLA